MILETERLRLRPLTVDDFDAYARLVGDADVMRYIGDGRPLTREEAWRHLALLVGHWQLRRIGMWGVEARASCELVGRIGFFEPEGWPGFELGWLIARSHQGRGLATEGAQVALDLAFLALGRRDVISVIHPENAASIRVAERLGERFERSATVGGRPASIYRIDRATWRASRPPDASDVPWVGCRVRRRCRDPRHGARPRVLDGERPSALDRLLRSDHARTRLPQGNRADRRRPARPLLQPAAPGLAPAGARATGAARPVCARAPP